MISPTAPRRLDTDSKARRRAVYVSALALALVAQSCGGSSPSSPSRPTPRGLACGVERWAVKTLSDADSPRVDLAAVRATTIQALNELPSHCANLPNARGFPEEFVTYEVVGRITYVRLEDDRDYHVALADPADARYTIVTELADTACAGASISPFASELAGARQSFEETRAGRLPSAMVGTTVRVRGVGFYDFDHGQVGRSRNCLELHPVVLFSTTGQ